MLLVLLFGFAHSTVGRANQLIYGDSLENGWQNWSSQTTVALDNSNPVHSGSQSIAVSISPYGYFYLHHTEFDSSPYAELSFWINGGSTGGQVLALQGVLDAILFQRPVWLAPLQADTWQQITVPLASLGVANSPNLGAFCLNDALGTGQATFYVDDIQLTTVPEPHALNLLGLGFLGLIGGKVWGYRAGGR